MLIVSGTLKSASHVGGSSFEMHIKEQSERKNGYDVGFIKDEFGCNLSQCECANFDEIVIGKFELLLKLVA